MKDSTPIINIYAQEQWHREAYIVANTEGLKSLRDSIDRVLNNKSDRDSILSFVVDGEGYDLWIMNIDDPQMLNKLSLPYTDEIAKQSHNESIHPWQI